MSSSPPIVKAPIDQTTLNAQKTVCRGRYRVIGEDLEVMATVLIDPTTGEAMTISTQSLNKPDWALGTAKIAVIPNTAGNVSVTLSVPAGKRWLMQGFFAQIDTDATVGNRTFIPWIRNGSFSKAGTGVGTIPANTSNGNGAESVGSTDWTLENPCILDGDLGDFFKLSVTNGAAGDVWHADVKYIEMTK